MNKLKLLKTKQANKLMMDRLSLKIDELIEELRYREMRDSIINSKLLDIRISEDNILYLCRTGKLHPRLNIIPVTEFRLKE